MALVVFVAIALLLAAVLATSMLKAQAEPVRVRVNARPRRARRF